MRGSSQFRYDAQFLFLSACPPHFPILYTADLSLVATNLHSERMYKSRLSKWSFNKNASQRDWQIAAVMKEERQKRGKETVGFKIHNRTKSVLELKRHIKECRVTEKDFIATAFADTNGVTNSASVRCISPPPDRELKTSADSSDQPSTSSGPIGAGFQRTPTSSKGSGKSQTQQPPLHSSGLEERSWSNRSKQIADRVPLVAATMPNLSFGNLYESQPNDASNGSHGARNVAQCDHVQQELGIMLTETYHPDGFTTAFPETKDLDSWELISKPDPSAEPKLCPKCQSPNKDHSPLPQEWLLNPSFDLPQMLSYQITSTSGDNLPGSNEASKFQACCFAACIYGGQEQFDLLAKSLQQADHIFESMLLENNDMALLSVLLTLTILHAHDRGTMATSIIRSAYHVSYNIYGERNPITLCIEWLTAAAGKRLPQCPIKSEMLRMIHKNLEQTFGKAHQHTIVALYCLSFQLILEKSYPEAEAHFTSLCGICVETLGECSLQTVSSLNGLGKSQRRQGKLNDAIVTLERSLKKHPLGPNHPFRLDSMKELAKVYKEVGRTDLVERTYWYVLKGRIKMLGKTHSFTEEAKIDLERLLRDLGKWDEEGVMEERVQKLFENGALTSDAEGF
jgi:hypothetical protein